MSQTHVDRERLVTLLVVLVLVGLAAGAWYYSRDREPTDTGVQPPTTNQEANSEGESLRKLHEELNSFRPWKPKGLAREKVLRAVELSSHPQFAVRAKAITALGFAEDAARPEALAAVMEKLRDPDILMRITAMGALANLDAKDRIPDLLPFLESADESERKNARESLKKLGHPIE
jgi:HEAT repeat protein